MKRLNWLFGWVKFYWHQFRISNLLERLFATAGATWGVVEMLAFFGKTEVSEKLQSIWWVILVLVLVLTAVREWPKRKFRFKINGRDIYVAIQLGDILNSDNSFVVPINHKFLVDPRNDILTSKSILSKFIKKLFNNSPGQLQRQIDGVINQNPIYNQLSVSVNPVIYKIGTVVPVYVDSKQVYMLANTSLNSNDRSHSTDEDLKNSLSELWNYIASASSKDTLSIPLLGTGMGRSNMSREKVIKEIILSFIASLGYQTHCDELIIVIHPLDYYNHTIQLEYLIDFMKLQCEHYDAVTPTGPPMGRAVSLTP